MPDSDDTMLLNEQARCLHRTLIDAVLTTGCSPSVSELADQLGSSPEAIQEAFQVLAAADYLALNADGRLTCLYPLSVSPTPHTVVVNGTRRFAMCAIDALGMPAMLDRALDIEASCAVCDTPVALRVCPGTVRAASPPTAMVVARRDEAEPAFAACCPFTVFVCGQEHADQFVRRIGGTNVLTLPEALEQAEGIFGNLLDERIPASRPRGKRWKPSRDA
jgi:hypothetical protein